MRFEENEKTTHSEDTPRSGRTRRTAPLRHTKRLTAAALLVALSFLLGLLAKSLQGMGPLRFTLEGMPIVLSGIVLGPFYGAAVGLCADLASCLMAGQTPLPLVAIGAALVGLVPGVLSRILLRGERLLAAPMRFPLILLFDGCAHLLGSVIIKSWGLSAWYGFNTLILRLPIYCGIVAIESYLLYTLLRSAAVRREIERGVLR